jgi:Tfp pilus assembly protein FimT
MELILVLVLIAVVAGIAAPSLHGFFVSRQSADAATKVLALTQWCRSESVAMGRRCRLNLNQGGDAFTITVEHAGTFIPPEGDLAAPFGLPEGARAALRQAVAPGAPTEVPSYVQFYPTGRNDVASIEIHGRSGEVYLVASNSPTESFHIISPTEASRP